MHNKTELNYGFYLETTHGAYFVRGDYIAHPSKDGRPTTDVGVSSWLHLEALLDHETPRRTAPRTLEKRDRFDVHGIDQHGQINGVVKTFYRSDILSVSEAIYPTTEPVVHLNRCLATRLREVHSCYTKKERQ